MKRLNRLKGLTLIELLLALLIGAVLLAGLVQIAVSARSSFLLQEATAEIQENGRFVADSVGRILRQAVFTPDPWLAPIASPGLTADTADAVNAHGDRLTIRTWSERNCFGSLNSSLDAQGRPEFFLKESVLELNSSNNLAHSCRYGADASNLVDQVVRQGLVQNVEAFQALYAEDIDNDGTADRWVTGGNWDEAGNIKGLHLAVLIRSNRPVSTPVAQTFNVLDHVISRPADGRLRRIVTYAQWIPAGQTGVGGAL